MIAFTKLLNRNSEFASHAIELRAVAHRIYTWWRGEFLAVLPSAVARHFQRSNAPTLFVHCNDIGVTFEFVMGAQKLVGKATAWSDYSAASLQKHLQILGVKQSHYAVVLVLPRSNFFHRSLEIPFRSGERLDAISRQELAHRTPFRIEDVYVSTAIEAEDRKLGILRVCQVVIRRDLVEKALHRCNLDLAQVAYVAEEGAGTAASISLQSKAEGKNSRLTRLSRRLAIAAVLLICADAVLFWWMRELAIADLESQIASVQEKARSVGDMERNVANVQKSLAALNTRRALPTAANLWRDTSRVLPDNSWVTDWRFADGTVSLSGLSSSATSLVSLFEQTPPFRDASLTAPIAYDSVFERDRFSLSAKTKADQRAGARGNRP